MACPDKEKLMDWVLDELSAGEGEELQRHVARCSDCAQSLVGLQDIRQTLVKQLVDREMPAHLVFVPEKPRAFNPGFMTSLWRTAALAGVAGVVFLAIVLGGYRRWGHPPSPVPGVDRASMTRAEIETLVRQAVRFQLTQQRQGLETANERLAADLRKEQERALAPVAAQLQYLQSAQSVVWKQAQEQNALVELIARNSLGREAVQPSRP
jgi:hypothetical protein